ncbi:hypothetical protein JXI42_14045 [bacterium]|nr:hypothetical protein [bacterium]
MSYVPYGPPPQSSPRAQELSMRLKETIDKYKRDNPDLTSGEIRQALSMVSVGAAAKKMSVAIGLAVALMLLGLLGFFFAQRGGEMDITKIAQGLPTIAIVLVVILGVGVLFLSKRNS